MGRSTGTGALVSHQAACAGVRAVHTTICPQINISGSPHNKNKLFSMVAVESDDIRLSV